MDATSNRVLWRDTFRGSARDLSGIQEKITAGVHHGLIAALGISPASSPSAKGSNSEEAYELYLRAAFDENSSDSSYEQPIRLLERAVALDRGYAAAWARLGHLYYYEAGSLGNGGTADRLRAKAALQKAVALDPEQIQATFASLGKYDRLEALELLHRLRIAKPFANEESFRAFRSLFHDDQFFRWNTHTCLIQVGEAQKEIKRSLNNEDYESAYLKLCRLYDVLIDAFLFSIGQSLDRWKWRLPKLRAAGRPDLLARYLDVQIPRVNGSEELRRFVDDQLAASSLIQDEIKDRMK